MNSKFCVAVEVVSVGVRAPIHRQLGVIATKVTDRTMGAVVVSTVLI